MLARTQRTMHLDFETRSTVDLAKQGVHVYAECALTDVHCAAYAFDDDEEIQLWVPGDPCPPEIVEQCSSGGPILAHNSAFERLIWTHVLHPRYDWPLPQMHQWGCTMARAFAHALPGGLDAAARAVGLTISKYANGAAVMKALCKPHSYVNGEPIWLSKQNEDPERLRFLMQELYSYCMQDVRIERELHKRLCQLRPSELEIWRLDQVINDRGIGVDWELCETMNELVSQATRQLNQDMRSASAYHVQTAASVKQIIKFCTLRGVFNVDEEEGTEEEIDSLRKSELDMLLAREDLPNDVQQVLELRSQASKISVRKINALMNGKSDDDGRVRGLLSYHAASTGRWAGRRFQPQNLKRPTNSDQNMLLDLIRTKSISAIELIEGPPLEAISNVLRGLIVPEEGKWIYAGDFSNIEGRGLAWLAGEQWKLDAYAAYDRGEGPDLYRLAYARAFNVPIDKVTDQDRQLGKVMELALGYQGGVGAFQSMAANYGVKVEDERADELKKAWRDAHPKTVQFWYDIDSAARQAVLHPGEHYYCGRLRFVSIGPFLYMRLPSGRALSYPYPKVMNLPVPLKALKKKKNKDPTNVEPKPKQMFKDMLTYKTSINAYNANKLVDKKEKATHRGWGRISVYGGLLTENAVQAIARDVMAEAMIRVENGGFPVIMTVHDEIVSEAGDLDVELFKRLIERRPNWAPTFPIVAKTWRDKRYKKD